MLIAVTREVSPDLGQYEISHAPRQTIDIELARSQHRQYERALEELGYQVVRLSVGPNLPDSVFVEDTAIVLDEIAIITRPGAETRRAETISVSEELSQYRPLSQIESPGTLDGGDVLKIGRKLYVGHSSRSNEIGFNQFSDLVAPYEYEVAQVQVDGCLHLKTAVTQVGEETLLINRAWVDEESFDGMRFIDVDPGEPYAANALLLGGELVYPTMFPKTRNRLEDRGFTVRAVDVSEMQKAEGTATCCSLIFRESSPTKNELDV